MLVGWTPALAFYIEVEVGEGWGGREELFGKGKDLVFLALGIEQRRDWRY